MTRPIPIPTFTDNLCYLQPCGGDRAIVVDPGDAAVVLDALAKRQRRVEAILLTHQHWDHVAGAAELRSQSRCQVIGVDRSLIPACDHVASDGQTLTLGDLRMTVIATPGHTRASVCYLVRSNVGDEPGVVYTGDTLFVSGCGRLLECDAATMWESLQRLAALPAETLVFCGHDYALENCEFAVATAPADRRFRDRLAQVERAVEYGQPTVPSTIAQERAANIFLRANDPHVKEALGMANASPQEVLAELRRRKDSFAT